MESKLSSVERETLARADDFDKLVNFKGWHRALDHLRLRIQLAEERRDANLSSDAQVAWALQMVARERKATLDSLLLHIADAKAERKEVLKQIFNVDDTTIDAAMDNELEMRAAALGENQ